MAKRPIVIGVRHHSPACARLVRAVILRERPRFVLIEGPSDMNERMDELRLEHGLPIALFSYRQDGESGSSRGMWTPFCDYSPEWVALHAAKEIGATALFNDLPAWHDAFVGEENRYSDRHVRASDRIGELCTRLGFEDTDALWDHLFEQPERASDLESRLDRYFAELRGDEPGGHRDDPREDFMNRYIAWAMREAGDAPVVVVCGGYHKPALERGWSAMDGEKPTLTEPPGSRIGSYLVPFSFKRLDSFAGYASGMPSPAFHQAVWEKGPEIAADSMLFSTVKHLREKKQRVSPADVIAAKTLAEGLRQLRGHRVLTRIDVLDGLAGALVKDALDAPLPWTRRGVLLPGTDPMLVEMVAAFSGERIGTLGKGTPRPPLAIDAFAELERVGIDLGRNETKVKVDLDSDKGVQKSRVLHRLRILKIPGFARTRGPSLTRAQTSLGEEWTVVRKLETDTSLVEAAIFGATLESATAAKLEEVTREAATLPQLAEALVEAALAGIGGLTDRWLGVIESLVAREASLGALGNALARLLTLWRGEAVLGAKELGSLGGVLRSCFERGLWLLEGVRGENAPYDAALVDAVRALRDALRFGQESLSLDGTRAHAVCERCVSDMTTPASLRGATLGFLWSTDGDVDQDRAVNALRAASRPETLGDFLSGVFALAREQVVRTPDLVAAVDTSITGFGREDFFLALPALRQAFAFFPPRERLTIAESLVDLAGGPKVDPRALLDRVEIGAVTSSFELEKRVDDVLCRYGLENPEKS
ncbi:DUF5682 family protein [soil metagenome]